MSNDKQQKLDLGNEPSTLDSVEDYNFDPIKGYPMLRWKGKRPYTSTKYYPAQLKEDFGKEIDGWKNKIFWGDNLQVMSHLLKEYRGQVDLIYIDPPFDSKADYKKKIKLKGKELTNDQNSFETKQYTDIWNNDEYLQYMYERLILMRELLSSQGNLILHCDWHKVHHLRCMLDEVFGNNHFLNEIIWCYSVGGKSKTKFGEKHDTLLWYGKTSNWIFNPKGASIPRKPNSHMKLLVDQDGRKYQQKKDKKSGKIYTYYLDEGKIAEDYWLDIETLNREDAQRQGYPTQKPEKLLERIINSCSNKNSIVFDCFMGSGTTQAVAMKLGRRFIGADINLGAVETTTKRLLKISTELEANKITLFSKTDKENKTPTTYYTGFEVYNVNHYDVFRNPAQAKEILIEALEIQRLPKNSVYDGEKDGRLVKIMPINRIATRKDLNNLISGFNYRAFDKKAQANPGHPVLELLLVCMGHEPDLAASLQKEVPDYKLDIEVVDILRDKTNLEFKRDSEVKIEEKDGSLVITHFYPMNLLTKLSLDKTKVDKWEELVESIKIDWNYDGAVFQPTTIDIPDKKEFVKGSYPIPKEAGTIRMKITDLLSESLEQTIN